MPIALITPTSITVPDQNVLGGETSFLEFFRQNCSNHEFTSFYGNAQTSPRFNLKTFFCLHLFFSCKWDREDCFFPKINF